MEQKEIILVNKGMRRDLSVSKTGESSAYDNRNIRITATDRDTLLSVTNERGNKEIENLSFSGTLIGHAVLNDYIVLFTADGDTSRIYRVKYEGESFSGILLFEGTLGFDTEHPIEIIADYETEDIQKVYWLDGKHVLRFINIADTYLKAHLKDGSTWDDPKFTFADYDDWFDSTRSSSQIPDVTISKDNSGNSRANGVTQYFLTYYNKNGQQTGIIYSSPLVYLSPEGRGGATDQTNSNRIVLSVSGLDTTFEYVRLYSIMRSSLDGDVVGYIVGDSSITEGNATFVDDGAHLEAADPTSFLYLGSSEAHFQTMAQKDGTLFLGNMSSVGYAGVDGIEDAIRENAFILSGDEFTDGTDWESAIVSFKYSTDRDITSQKGHIPYVTAQGYYPYDSQLQYTNAQISTFKGGEKYRFALRFVRSNGTMSKPFWIGDKVNPYYPIMTYSSQIVRAVAVCVVPDAIVAAAKEAGFSSAQLMIAQASYSDRSVQAQGIVSPTVFNLYDRYSGRDFAQSSWIYRPRRGNYPYKHLSVLNKSDSPYSELQCNWWSATENSTVPSALLFTDSDGNLINKPDGYRDYDAQSLWINVTASKDFLGVCEYDCYISVAFWSGETLLTEKREHFSTNNSKKSVVAKCLRIFDELDIDTILRPDAGMLYELLDRAKDGCSYLSHNKIEYSSGKTPLGVSHSNKASLHSRLNRQFYFVDESIITLNSPEITCEAVSLDRNSGLKFRLVGVSLLTSNISDYLVETDNREYPGGNIVNYQFSHQNISEDIEGLSAWPLYSEYGYQKNNDDSYSPIYAQYNYMMYMWQKSGSVPSFAKDEKQWSLLTKKLFANLHYSHFSIYNNYKVNTWSVTPSDVRQVSPAGAVAYELKRGLDTVIYTADIEKAVLVPDDVEYPVYYSKDVVQPGDAIGLEFAKTVSDSVTMTYKSTAHAVIGLPVGSSDTILPYLNEDEAVVLNTDEGTSHAPWLSNSYSGQTLLYRSISLNDDTAIADLNKGAYGTFQCLAKSDAGYLTARCPVDTLNDTTKNGFDAMLDAVADSGKIVFVHLKYDNNGEENIILADASAMTSDETQVWAFYSVSAGTVKIKFSSKLAMSSIYIALYYGNTLLHSETVQLGNDTTSYTFKLKHEADWKWLMSLSYKVSYTTYKDGSNIEPLVPELDATAVSDRLVVTVFPVEKLTERYYVLKSALTVAFSGTFDTTYLNIAYTPNYKFRYTFSGGDGTITNLGEHSDEYKNPDQSEFVLSDTTIMKNTSQKYLFIGELYQDYDTLAAKNPSLDTRYGGITESAVEGNTFISAGKRTPLSYTESVDGYAKAELDSGSLLEYILKKTGTSNFNLKMLNVNKDGENALEEISLLSINRLTVDDFLPTSTNKTKGLRVEQSGDGWISVIDGLAEGIVSKLQTDDSYKIAVLRNGYARKGEWRHYKNKYGNMQTTHTARDMKRLRTMRRGYNNGLPAYRLRIIGIDQLICSGGIEHLKKYSSTYRHTDVYNNSTLVSQLGTPLVLPKKNYAKTQDGRYSQRIARDLAELFIGLYHKENGDWKLVSNVVQVRGRNKDRTQVWEFDETNIVAPPTA